MKSSIVTLAIALCTNPGMYCHDKPDAYTCDLATLDKECLAFVVEKSSSDKGAVSAKKKYDACLTKHTHRYRESSATYRDDKFQKCLEQKVRE